MKLLTKAIVSSTLAFGALFGANLVSETLTEVSTEAGKGGSSITCIFCTGSI